MDKPIRIAALSALLLLLSACATVGTFDRSAAEQLQALTEEEGEFISAMFASPTDISLQSVYGGLPAPLAGFLHPISPQQAGECFIDGNGSDDEDDDGVPQNASFSVDCTFEDGIRTVALEGAMTVQDDDDADPLSGYDVVIENFGFSIVNRNNGNEFVRTFDLLFDLDLVPGPNPSYAVTVDFDYNHIGPIVGAANITFVADWTYVPDDAGTPFAGGTFEIDDTLSFLHNANLYTLQRSSSDLHFDASCLTANKFDDGSVAYVDSLGNSFVLDYTSCGNATGTFSSAPAQAGY